MKGSQWQRRGGRRYCRHSVLAGSVLLCLMLIGCQQPRVKHPGLTPPQDAQQVALSDLKAQANQVLNLDSVSARRDVDVVFALVDRLLAVHEQDEAMNYLSRGVLIYPWNLKYQMLYAELLAGKGQQEKASEKAALVLKYAETDDLIARARKLLHKDPLPELPGIQTLPGTHSCIVLIPMQGCEKWLILRIRDELTSTLGIPVVVQTLDMQYPPAGRDRRQYLINLFRRNIAKNHSDPLVVKCMKDENLRLEDLRIEENALKLMRRMARQEGLEKVGMLDAALEEARGKDPQWDSDQLLEALCKAVTPFRRGRVAYLGVTAVDIFTGDSNYLFGWAGPSGGVMSYKRFTADFWDDPPNQERLVKRALMQSLSSIGFVYGIQRCADPTCSRAYPNSLQEHDAKTGSLCPECRSAFSKVMGGGK